MEENFFEYYSPLDEVLWLDEALLPPLKHQGSAFLKYTSQLIQGSGSNCSRNHESIDRNVNKRMIQFLQKSWKTPISGPVETEKERNHKHMINERMRRVKQKQNFLELHKLLPLGTKGDKNSIVQMATERIQELRRCKEELKRRKIELENALSAANHDDEQMLEEAKLKLRVAHPSSGVDSMLEVLRCFKDTGTKAKAIKSKFSSQEFSAELQIEAKVGAAEVEKAVQKALFEVEKKFRCSF